MRNRHDAVFRATVIRYYSLATRHSFLFIPFQYHAAHHSPVLSVILNEVKDLSSENKPNLDFASLGRSVAFARDGGDYFFSFHFSTTPCITPPISRSFSL
jgi:hypothetical protein